MDGVNKSTEKETAMKSSFLVQLKTQSRDRNKIKKENKRKKKT